MDPEPEAGARGLCWVRCRGPAVPRAAAASPPFGVSIRPLLAAGGASKVKGVKWALAHRSLKRCCSRAHARPSLSTANECEGR